MLGVGRFLLGQGELEDAVLVLRFGLALVNVVLEREAAILLAVVALAADDRLTLLFFLFAFYLGTNRYLVAVDRNFDVFLLGTRNIGLDLIDLVVFGRIKLDLGFLGKAFR